MTELSALADMVTANGAANFLEPASLRQPAGDLGPKAQRTIARIIDATRTVFLTRGYAGTTIDEIARAADVSRASFYTYFESKREVLLAIGTKAADDTMEVINRLPELGTTRAGLTRWVGEYFDLLDVHGSFSFAWTQAAHDDPDIRTMGMKGHLRLCRHLGENLAATAGRVAEQPEVSGLVAAGALERSWNYWQLYAETVDRADVVANVSVTLWGAARQASSARAR